MLKYQLNVNKIKNDIVPIVLNEYSIETLQGDAFKDKKMLSCYTEEDIDFDMGANIVSMYEQYMVNDDFISSTAYNFNTIYHPFGVNKEKKFFSLLFDAYFYLTADRTSIITDEDNNNKQWWYIWFNGSHLFETEDSQTYTLYVGYNTASGYTKGEIEVSADNVVTSSVLRFEKSVLESLDNLEWEELRNVIFFEEDGRQVSDLTNVSFFRDNFIFTDGMFSLFLDRATEGVIVPLSQKFSTDLLQDELINHDFVNEERRKAINRITDMEKDIYYPVIWDTANKRIYYSNSGGKVKNGEVYNIEFNLHFRKHEGDNWLVSPTSYWNGVNDNATFYSNGFFNTAYPNKESQPDLLTYLGFTNNDVKYQKNKLKKSFLRLMFFDSMSPTNQNLLAYYTVFMDSGGYFSKFVKHVELTDYYKAPADGGRAITDLVGLRVDREPTIDERGELIQESTVDEVRLGTRFIISDKYSSDASSEGFYLYLWKDNFEGTVPQDIYMKVEFNHAGYGRTIPFMMPFWDNKKWPSKTGIKTFEEILADWKNGSGTDGPYGIQQYLKYSYIHFKYRYDKATKRHVYYLDDEFYGTDPSKGGVHFANNKITLNLYEAKIV